MMLSQQRDLEGVGGGIRIKGGGGVEGGRVEKVGQPAFFRGQFLQGQRKPTTQMKRKLGSAKSLTVIGSSWTVERA